MAESLVALRDRRHQVIARLSEGYASDLLEVEELERRLDLAHAARTVAELDALIADLAPTRTTALAPLAPLAVDDPSRAEQKRLRVILSHVARRGRWTVPRTLELRVLWGNAELDLREASLAPGVTTIDVSVWMGNVELVVPPHLAVDVDVSSFMGAVEERHRMPPDADPTRPVLRLAGAVRLGNLEISTRLPGETRGDASRRERRERRERKQLREARGRALPEGSTDDAEDK
jgi:hypothetical protein